TPLLTSSALPSSPAVARLLLLPSRTGVVSFRDCRHKVWTLMPPPNRGHSFNWMLPKRFPHSWSMVCLTRRDFSRLQVASSRQRPKRRGKSTMALWFVENQLCQLLLVLFSHRLIAQIVQLRLVGKHRTRSDEAGILRQSRYETTTVNSDSCQQSVQASTMAYGGRT